jgi:hypothetical protein
MLASAAVWTTVITTISPVPRRLTRCQSSATGAGGDLALGDGLDLRVIYNAPPHPRATLVMLPAGPAISAFGATACCARIRGDRLGLVSWSRR